MTPHPKSASPLMRSACRCLLLLDLSAPTDVPERAATSDAPHSTVRACHRAPWFLVSIRTAALSVVCQSGPNPLLTARVRIDRPYPRPTSTRLRSIRLQWIQPNHEGGPPPVGIHLNPQVFGSDIAVEIRREVYGEDQGQQGWRTLDEQAQIAALIDRRPCHVLDIGCGSGGPSLALVAATGCTLTSIDREASAIEPAQRLASERGLSDKARFVAGDCRDRLPFEDGSFDVVVCIDAILHLGDRFATLADWGRLLCPGGRLLFTDAAVLTGAISIEALNIRASQGSFMLGRRG